MPAPDGILLIVSVLTRLVGTAYTGARCPALVLAREIAATNAWAGIAVAVVGRAAVRVSG